MVKVPVEQDSHSQKPEHAQNSQNAKALQKRHHSNDVYPIVAEETALAPSQEIANSQLNDKYARQTVLGKMEPLINRVFVFKGDFGNY